MDIGVELDDRAPIAVHLCHPTNFKPLPGKKNILATMFEMAPVPDEFPEGFKKADAIIVPSKFCYELFRPLTDKRIKICKLGFDPFYYTFEPRHWTPMEKPFRWLWVGAPNPRKGWPALINAWAWLIAFSRRERLRFSWDDPSFIELYMKTSLQATQGQIIQHEDYPNVTLDSRRYEATEDLAALYHSAHAFVLPTQGEGYGLSAQEAIATGLPVVTSGYGAQTEFLKNDAYYHTYTFETLKDKYGIPLRAACPDVASLAKCMLHVVANYEEALYKAASGALRIHRKYTWEHAARQLIIAIEQLNLI